MKSLVEGVVRDWGVGDHFAEALVHDGACAEGGDCASGVCADAAFAPPAGDDGIANGDAADVAAAFTSGGLGAVVNSSRGINFAYRREPYAGEFGEERWEEAIEAATRQMIVDLAEHTPAGALR